MPCSTRARIFSSSPAVGSRLTSPMTAERTDPCPMKLPMFTDFWRASSFARNGPSGTGEPPSGPSISVVTPCRT